MLLPGVLGGGRVTDSDPAPFILARVADLETAANQAAPGPWIARTLGRADQTALIQHERSLPATSLPIGPLVADFCGHPASMANATHAALNNPAAVLADVEQTRQLVAAILAMPHDYNDADPYYSCALAVDPYQPGSEPGSGCYRDTDDPLRCDCGRDARAQHMLKIIARRWPTHPDYQETWNR